MCDERLEEKDLGRRGTQEEERERGKSDEESGEKSNKEGWRKQTVGLVCGRRVRSQEEMKRMGKREGKNA